MKQIDKEVVKHAKILFKKYKTNYKRIAICCNTKYNTSLTSMDVYQAIFEETRPALLKKERKILNLSKFHQKHHNKHQKR